MNPFILAALVGSLHSGHSEPTIPLDPEEEERRRVINKALREAQDKEVAERVAKWEEERPAREAARAEWEKCQREAKARAADLRARQEEERAARAAKLAEAERNKQKIVVAEKLARRTKQLEMRRKRRKEEK